MQVWDVQRREDPPSPDLKPPPCNASFDAEGDVFVQRRWGSEALVWWEWSSIVRVGRFVWDWMKR